MKSKEQSSIQTTPADIGELRELVEKAKMGEAGAVPQLRAFLDDHPQVFEYAGDLERIVIRAWTEQLAGDDPLSAEAVSKKAEQLRAELEGDNPTPLEKMLVAQVVILWMELSHAQFLSASHGKGSPGQASCNRKRSESALRRYLAAIKTLTTVRHLLPRGLLPAHPLRLFNEKKKQA